MSYVPVAVYWRKLASHLWWIINQVNFTSIWIVSYLQRAYDFYRHIFWWYLPHNARPVAYSWADCWKHLRQLDTKMIWSLLLWEAEHHTPDSFHRKTEVQNLESFGYRQWGCSYAHANMLCWSKARSGAHLAGHPVSVLWLELSAP